MGSVKRAESIFGSSAKYKLLVLKISEYPLNKELLRMETENISPPANVVREAPERFYKGSVTESRALKIADLRRRIWEVDKALEAVPEEYRNGVLYHTIFHGNKGIIGGKGSAWGGDMFAFAHPNTWKKWKTRFILEYAKITGEMDNIDLLNRYRPQLDQPADISGYFHPGVVK